MSNVTLLKGSRIFVKPKLKWADRQKEKSLLSLRHTLKERGLKRELMRIRNLQLFYDGKFLDDKLPPDQLFSSLNISQGVTPSDNAASSE